MRGPGAARPREADRGRRHPDPLLDLDPLAARAGPEQRAIDPLRSRARRAGCRDAARYQHLPDPPGRQANSADCQPALFALLEAAVLAIFPKVQPLPHEMLPAHSPDVLEAFHAEAVELWEK